MIPAGTFRKKIHCQPLRSSPGIGSDTLRSTQAP